MASNEKNTKKAPYSSKTTVESYPARRLALPYATSRMIFWLRGVQVKYTNKVGGPIESPSIVLCNHGSFIDFAYAGTLLRKQSPHFVVARLYFYKKLLGKILRRVGCFPKSMFTADLESAKNCLRVLKNGKILAMMPEARLSTVGRFEDVQEGTYAFLKKSNVPIYSIKMNGDFMAKPKWGVMRRGALVEAELDLLIGAEELKSMSVEDVKARVEERLYYDEFEWLKQHPEIRYRSKRMAEGLENILTTCPKCLQKYTLSTQKCDIFCARCGKIATVTDRADFADKTYFENFARWYDWQKETLRQTIVDTPDYELSSPVTFFLPSEDGKKMLREAGSGVCVLNREGLFYRGTKNGETVELSFPLNQIYRLLFGAGENFEIYVGSEIHYFVPKEKRSAVEWYMASSILVDESKKETLHPQH